MHPRHLAGGRPLVHRRHRAAGRRLGRQDDARTVSRCTVCINDGDTHNSPTEQLEAKFPVLVEKLPDPPGQRRRRPVPRRPGRRDGGAGALALHRDDPHRPRPLQALGPGRRRRRDGQRPGRAPQGRVEDRPPQREDLQRAPGAWRRLQDALGWWRRLRRPTGARLRKVAEDVREGYVSTEVAREVYRVALDSRGRVHHEATQALRKTPRPVRDGASMDVAWDGQ